jgi:phospholipase C
VTNRGRLGAHLQARSRDLPGGEPLSWTVAAGASFTTREQVQGPYDVRVHGPNGFYRRFAGDTATPMLTVRAGKRAGHLVLRLHNRSGHPQHLHVADAYGPDRTLRVAAGASRTIQVPLTHGWYDVRVTVRDHPHHRQVLAGRIENGRPLTSDPQLGR